MAHLFHTPIDLNQLEVLNPTFQLLGSAPGTPVEGQFYYNTTDDGVYFRNGSAAWEKFVGTINNVGTIAGAVDGANDYFVIYDGSASANVKVAVDTLLSDVGPFENVLTFSNGLTRTVDAIALGGTLTGNTTINGSTSYYLDVTGSSGSIVPLHATNTSTGTALLATASESSAIESVIETTNTNSVYQNITLTRTSSGTPANGIGSSIQFNIETTVATRAAGSFQMLWTDATDATRTSAIDLYTTNSGSTSRKVRIAGSGQLTLDGYGTGTFTGTDAYWLAVDSSGNIIEEAAPGGVSDTYSTVTGDTGTASATGAETLDFSGGTGISTTVTAGSPDDVTIAIDVNSTVDFSASTPVWTFGNETTAEGLFVTGTPVDGNHVVNKTYVDNLASGLDGKASVLVATTADITIATALNSGDTIDGVLLADGDRVLVKNQAAPAENGIYVVDASPFRATDADAWDELVAAYVWVEEGTVNQDTGWLCTVDAGGTLNTTAVTWTLFASATALIAGEGLAKTGNAIDLDLSDLTSLGATAALDDTLGIYDTDAVSTKKITVANLLNAHKYATTTNVGTAEGAVVVNHALNSTDVIVQVYDTSTSDVITIDIDITDANNVTIQASGSTRSVRCIVMR